jgi:lipopolysaccharide heptosyltransferase II
MNILVRLPNWLGDMVMSVGFLNQLKEFYPGASISLIAKKGIHELLPFFPQTEHQFIFSKEQNPGLAGLIRFGKEIKKNKRFDLFFCLPDSFSSALMGYATAAKQRVGYKKELRQLLLTHSYDKPAGLHRVEEYVRLLELFSGRKMNAPINVRLEHQFEKKDHVVVNINSEASSRRLTISKAVEILTELRRNIDSKILLIGAPKEKDFVEQVLSLVPGKHHIESIAGSTRLSSLVEVLASAKLMLTTDSGPAHLSNALGTNTIILFGAGNENNTAPYQEEYRRVIRLGKLGCEPCMKNTCVRYSTPQCLELLETPQIIQNVKDYLENGKRIF